MNLQGTRPVRKKKEKNKEKKKGSGIRYETCCILLFVQKIIVLNRLLMIYEGYFLGCTTYWSSHASPNFSTGSNSQASNSLTLLVTSRTAAPKSCTLADYTTVQAISVYRAFIACTV